MPPAGAVFGKFVRTPLRREGRNASDFFEPVEGPTEIVMPLRFAAMLRLGL